MAVTKPERPPGGWSYDDLWDLPEDGTRYEIIDGELYELPSPNFEHAIAVANIFALLLPVVRSLAGRVLTAPLDVRFPGADPVQPDVLVLLPERLARTSGKRVVEGAPNLVVEVLSPSNREHDLVRKRNTYARGGVSEYWLVDPRAQTVEVLALRDGVYAQHVVAHGAKLVTSTVLSGLAFPASSVFA